MNVSWDGELVVACTTDPLLDRANGQALLFDPQGNLLHSTEIGGFPSGRPAISPDNRYVAIPLRSGTNRSLVMLDGETGGALKRFERWARKAVFTPDGSALATISSSACLIELDGRVDQWGFSDAVVLNSNLMSISVPNGGRIVSVGIWDREENPDKMYAQFIIHTDILQNGSVVYRDTSSHLDLSPNAYFGISYNSREVCRPNPYHEDFNRAYLNALVVRGGGV
jgi:hypothetical protein